MGNNWTQVGIDLTRGISGHRYSNSPEQKEIDAIVSRSEVFGGTKNHSKAGTVYQGTSKKVDGCCIRKVNINGISVGIDKIDHFLGVAGEHWIQYNESKKTNKPLTPSDVLKMNV